MKLGTSGTVVGFHSPVAIRAEAWYYATVLRQVAVALAC